MNKARVFVNGILAGILEKSNHNHYRFTYETNYQGRPVSLTMPTVNLVYDLISRLGLSS